MGAAAEDIRGITDEEHSTPEGPQIITALQIGDRAVAIEDTGWRGAISGISAHAPARAGLSPGRSHARGGRVLAAASGSATPGATEAGP
ncbi:hypothetical protein [Nonomuraea sp. B12E4]|uniref:hypothetical protein n=1 Tax=Nonomuraea sp. B12E4 TaxID=3153564 RepID=UPI00325FD54C